MSKKNLFDLIDEPDNISGDIAPGRPATDTARVEGLVRQAISADTSAAPAKKRPVRRRFMIGLVAAVVSASVIGGAVAVVAQNNGNFIELEPLTPEESFSQEMELHYNPPTEAYEKFRNKLKEEAKIKGKEMFYKKNCIEYDEIGSENLTDTDRYDLTMQEAMYIENCKIEVLNKFINDGYGNQSLILETPEYYDLSGKYTSGKDKGKDYWTYNQDLDRYSDMIMSFCKALNDPDYEITEREKMLSHMYLDEAYTNIILYVNQYKTYTEKMREAYDMIEKTIVPTYGYHDLDVFMNQESSQ